MTENSTVNETVDDSVLQRRKIHPYDLSTNDNPGLLISQVIFNGENYDEWARELRTALRARKKFGFVDGFIQQPSKDSNEIDDWWTINSLLVSWIRNTIDKSLRRDISHFEIAKDLWDDICQQYGVVNGPRVQQLKHDLVTCKQRGMSIKVYYGKLKKIWEDLSNYEKTAQCTCHGCVCGAKSLLKQQLEKDKVHQFLMGLDESVYGNVKSSLLARDPLPTLNQTYSTLLQDESARVGVREHVNQPEITSHRVQLHASRGRSISGERSGAGVTCSGCGKSGHDASRCFAVVGYPPWWKGARVGAGSSVAGGPSEIARTQPASRGTSAALGQIGRGVSANFAGLQIPGGPIVLSGPNNVTGPPNYCASGPTQFSGQYSTSVGPDFLNAAGPNYLNTGGPNNYLSGSNQVFAGQVASGPNFHTAVPRFLLDLFRMEDLQTNNGDF